MNRYALFCGSYNLLFVGVKDFRGSVETTEEAKAIAEQIAKEERFANWVQVFDKKTDKAIIYSIVDGELKEREEKERRAIAA